MSRNITLWCVLSLSVALVHYIATICQPWGLSSAIAHIINLCLYSGRIPDDIKTARVVPLYKKIRNHNQKITGLFLF